MVKRNDVDVVDDDGDASLQMKFRAGLRASTVWARCVRRCSSRKHPSVPSLQQFFHKTSTKCRRWIQTKCRSSYRRRQHHHCRSLCELRCRPLTRNSFMVHRQTSTSNSEHFRTLDSSETSEEQTIAIWYSKPGTSSERNESLIYTLQ